MRKAHGPRASTASIRRNSPSLVERATRFASLALISLVAFASGTTLVTADESAAPVAPEKVVVPAGKLTLHALLWHPAGNGPFPAVLFNHGSGPTMEPEKPAALGPVFVRHGYAFLFLYRRGSGLSVDEGTSAEEEMDKELAAHGEEARDQLQLKLLDVHLEDALAGLAFLRARPEVDPKRVAVAGHSFGAMLALLMVARDDTLRAALDFAGAAESWASSQELRARLLDAVDRTKAAVFFIQANNDYSVAPSEVLATEMLGLDKPRRIEIYPGVGQTPVNGHNLVYLGVPFWENDVFAFLDEYMKK
jgi:dienelactone hydrolase